MSDSRPRDVAAVTDSAERDRRIVTGEKVFASDVRPIDLGWGSECAHALLLRATCVDRPIERVDPDVLPPGLRPHRVVTAAELDNARIRNHIQDREVEVELLVPIATAADYVGQPVAILLYEDFMRFRRAAQELREDIGPVVYGAPGPAPVDLSPQRELEQWTRLGLPSDPPQPQMHYLYDADRADGGYSFRSHGGFTLKDRRFVRGKPAEPDEPANALIDALAAEFDAVGAEQVQTTTYTQQIDPAFLEPEAGVAWLDRDEGTLRMVLGTQSPHGDTDEIKKILAEADVGKVELKSEDSGGSFGGRDKSPFALYLALAAYFCDTPVRLAFDRREQFQGGLKRHASAVRSLIGLDGDRLVARSFVVLRGGVEVNLNKAVLGLAALHATGPYRLARAGVHAVVLQRPIPTVGSMRGFGIPQVAFNIETAIDRLAAKLAVDPIDLRLQRIIRTQDGHAATDLAGTPLRFHVAAAGICEAARRHDLWTRRAIAQNGPRQLEDGTLYGVGFACCMEAYGTSEDSVYCAVRVGPQGHVEVWSQTAEVGQGARRSLEQVVRRCLGAEAPVTLNLGAAVEWFERFGLDLGKLESHREKINLTHSASAASKTAFFHTHLVEEACRALLSLRLLPAARSLLGDPELSDEELAAAWRDGALQIKDRDVPLRALAAEVHRLGEPPGVMAHGSFRDGWSHATFKPSDTIRYRAHIDGLGWVRSPAERVEPVEAQCVHGPPGAAAANPPPRSLYAAGGHLIAVRIDPGRARIRVEQAVTFLDAGDPIVRDVVAGQVEGGLAMGIAHTLFEELPPETGTGPFVNFDRYRLPRWSDLRDIDRDTVCMPLPPDGVLGPGEPKARSKGIGEVTMTTVAPAIANAIANALGNADERCWPDHTPIRFADLHLPEGLR